MKRNAERDVRELKFTWNNKGDMNGAFFELCETVRSEMVPLSTGPSPVMGRFYCQCWASLQP